MVYRDDDEVGAEDDEDMKSEDSQNESDFDEELDPVETKKPKIAQVIDDSLSEDNAMDEDNYSELIESDDLDRQEKLKKIMGGDSNEEDSDEL